MALEKEGVQLVVEGLQAFQAGLKAAGSAVTSLGSIATSAGKKIAGAFGEITTGALRRVGELITDLGRRALEAFGSQFLAGLQRAGQVDGIMQAWSRVGATFNDVAATLGAAVEPAFAALLNNVILPLLPSIQDLAVNIGNLIGALTIVGQDAVAAFGEALGGIYNQASGILGGVAADAGAWGSNIVMSLANGMAAAAGAIIDVLIGLGNIISSWLSPGSPPKLLPDLDRWGAGAMDAYLEGWKDADWGMFDELSGTIESFIRGMLDVPQEDIVPRILGSRDAIEAAINELRTLGTVGPGSIDAIMASIGTSDPAMRAYIESMVQMEAANRAVADAQAVVNAVTAKYDAILAPLNAELNAINERKTQMAEQRQEAQLNRILQSKTATAAQKEQARLELREIALKRQIRLTEEQKKQELGTANTQLDAAKAAADLAKQQMDAAKAQIAATTEQNKLMQEQLKLLQRLAQQPATVAGATAPKGIGGGGGGIGGLGGLGRALGGLSPAKMAAWAANIEGFLARLAAPFANLKGKIDELTAAWAPVIGAMGTFFSTFMASLEAGMPPLSAFLNAIRVTFGPEAAQVVAGFAASVQGAIGAVVTFVQTNWPIVQQTISTVIQAVWTVVTSVMASLQQWWAANGAAITASAQQTWNDIQIIVQGALAALYVFLTAILDGMRYLWDQHGQAITTIVTSLWNIIYTTVFTVLSLIQQFIHAMALIIQGDWQALGEQLTLMWNTLWTGIRDILYNALTILGIIIADIANLFINAFTQLSSDLSTIAGNTVNSIKSAFTSVNWGEIGKSVIDGIKNAINNGVGGLTEAARNAAQDAFDAFMAALQGGSPSRLFAQGGKWAIQGFIEGVQAMADPLGRAMADTALSAYDAFGAAAESAAGGMALPSVSGPSLTASRMPPVYGGGKSYIGPPVQGGNNVTVTANYAKYQEPPAIVRDFRLAMALL